MDTFEPFFAAQIVLAGPGYTSTCVWPTKINMSPLGLNHRVWMGGALGIIMGSEGGGGGGVRGGQWQCRERQTGQGTLFKQNPANGSEQHE